MPPGFSGTFDHSLDAKNRLTVPAKFRSALSDGVFLVRNQPECLRVFPAANYQQLADEAMRGINPLSREARRLNHLYFSVADEAELDGAGRITLSARQLAHAGIDGKEVAIVGAGPSLELWSPPAWAEYERELVSNPDDDRHAG